MPLSLPSARSVRRVAVAATACILSSCGGGGGSNTGPTSAPSSVSNDRPISQSNLEIAQTLYSGTPRTPTGFFKDEILADQIQTTVHLKNTDLDDSLTAPMPQYELCTDDWNQALDWSETHAAQASQYADLVDTKTTADFFEFDRFRTGTPETYVRERVFKCTYIDRSTADLRSPQGSAGHLNRRPLTAAELQSLVEYLWQFTSYNNFGHAVLQSSASKDSLTHTLFIANLTRAGVSASCDRVEVIAWRHTANANGELNLDIEALFSFGARESAGVTSLCSG